MKRYPKKQTVVMMIAGALIVLAFVVPSLKDLALLSATVLAGVPIGEKAWQALKFKAFSIELLVTIAVIGALFIGEYVESAVVTFLFLFGAYLEASSLAKTRASLKSLMDLAPVEARVVREGEELTIDVSEVKLGDTVRLRSGEKIPVDGKVLSGHCVVNEAAVTGESVPVTKSVDATVFSGTLVDHGYVDIVAEKVGEDTTVEKLIALVEEAQESKTKVEKFLQAFARIYTPSIIVLSILVLVITKNLHMAITFLVIACPGALVIGAPVSTVTGIGNGARNGVLIKGGETMDRLAKVDKIIFDKTGTLTEGKPSVEDIHVIDKSYTEQDLLHLAATVEQISEHHLGKTIVAEAKKQGLTKLEKITEGTVRKGLGVEGMLDGQKIIVGNRALMKESHVDVSDVLLQAVTKKEAKGKTVVFIAIDGKLVGSLSIFDKIRVDAKDAIAKLRAYGVEEIVMLTGDNKLTAKSVGTELGLDQVYAELLPEDKLSYVKKWQADGQIVLMAGDGINDAPSIATADVGVAMGEGGTDISMETADVVLMADKLDQLAHAFALAKATTKNVKQNTYLAVGVVAILLIGVLMGSVHLASGMFIHEASVLLVILNAMRLMKFGESKRKKVRRVLAERTA
ncbi:heavy metal translocating P-type ATPase [Saliterribacillus persicus]|uniref:Cd(2+)-exporting ATPase n=1 Tax=Saliterribacillus persicus TaxID=930114 RepID=A0A368YEI6_9BACI|nr:cation-translocating P-type ATPase [Saliterribacillus persicus]RCW77297.1 Cd2+/Zn2+-exporting ATPase [Saliterribacillus persicus]